MLPASGCPARGHVGKGHIGVHSRKYQRFICGQCRTTFTATKGPAFYRLRTSAEVVPLVVTLMAHGCPLHGERLQLLHSSRELATGEDGGGQGCRATPTSENAR
jgi:transposase-like protein